MLSPGSVAPDAAAPPSPKHGGLTAVLPAPSAGLTALEVMRSTDALEVDEFRRRYCQPWDDGAPSLPRRVWRALLGPSLLLPEGGTHAGLVFPEGWIWEARRPDRASSLIVFLLCVVTPMLVVTLVTLVPVPTFDMDETGPTTPLTHTTYIVSGVIALFGADFQSADIAAAWVGAVDRTRIIPARLKSHLVFMAWLFVFYATVGFPPVNFLIHGAMWTFLSLVATTQYARRRWRTDKSALKHMADLNNYFTFQVLGACAPCCFYMILVVRTTGWSQLAVSWGFALIIWLVKRIISGAFPPMKDSYLGFAVAEMSTDTLSNCILLTSFATADDAVVLTLMATQILLGLAAPVLWHRTLGKGQTPVLFSMGGSHTEKARRTACKFGIEVVAHVVLPLQVLVMVTFQRFGPNADNFAAGHWTDAEYERFVRWAFLWAALFTAVGVAARPFVRRALGADPLEMTLRLLRQHVAVICAQLTASVVLYAFMNVKMNRVLWLAFPEDGYSS